MDITRLKEFIKKRPFLLKISRILKSPGRRPSLKKKVKGKKNILSIHNSALFYNCKIKIVGNNNRITIDEGGVYNDFTIYILGDSNEVNLSKNIKFNRGGIIWMEGENCLAKIGVGSTFEDVHIAVTEPNSEIVIGNDCMFATDIDLRTGDSHSIIDAKTNKRINYAQNIYIEDHVWVGAYVSILKGVTIRKNSIIATRAVVTQSIKNEGVIIGGIPAKIIKENINWDRRRLQ